MPIRPEPTTAEDLADRLRTLRAMRRQQNANQRQQNGRRGSLKAAERKAILEKTDHRCHICGGKIPSDDQWHADHVLAHSGGGRHSVDNYLPADALCNNYRWNYLAEEFQYILKLGVWAANEIRSTREIGKEIAAGFIKKEHQRRGRQRHLDTTQAKRTSESRQPRVFSSRESSNGKAR